MNPAASLMLLPLSMAYGAVTRARATAYRWRLLPVSRLPVPVISVGNLTTGGTGKTPLVEWVCRTIDAVAHEGLREGKKMCVLTRGYGRANPNTQVVVSNGSHLRANQLMAGDEPFLLANNLLGISAVIANPDRLAAGEWAIKKLHSEVFVLDDGFQHLGLFRDLNIVSIDATNPWGGGLLPRGRLREPSKGLSRADCVVITRTDQVPHLAALRGTVQRFAGTAPVLSSRMSTSGFRGLNGVAVNRAALLSQTVGAFCGVGNPQSFFEHVGREGFQIAFTRTFPDHYNYTQSDFDDVSKAAREQGATGLITTAKDATKLQSFKPDLPCSVLDVQIIIDEEERLVDLIRRTIFKPTHGA